VVAGLRMVFVETKGGEEMMRWQQMDGVEWKKRENDAGLTQDRKLGR
jgi:hypothetical protein